MINSIGECGGGTRGSRSYSRSSKLARGSDDDDDDDDDGDADLINQKNSKTNYVLNSTIIWISIFFTQLFDYFPRTHLGHLIFFCW